MRGRLSGRRLSAQPVTSAGAQRNGRQAGGLAGDDKRTACSSHLQERGGGG